MRVRSASAASISNGAGMIERFGLKCCSTGHTESKPRDSACAVCSMVSPDLVAGPATGRRCTAVENEARISCGVSWRLQASVAFEQKAKLHGVGLQRRLQSLSGTIIITRGPSPTARVVCPLPVRSSAGIPSPGPKRCKEPSLSPISTPPASAITYWGRGALCQSTKAPGAIRVNSRRSPAEAAFARRIGPAQTASSILPDGIVAHRRSRDERFASE